MINTPDTTNGRSLKIFVLMNAALCILLCLILTYLPAAAADSKTEVVSPYTELPKLLVLAMHKNAAVSVALERIKQAEEDLNKASAEFSPELSVGGTARANDDGRYGLDKNETNALLNISQTLYAGGSLTANKRAAKMALSAQIAESTRMYQEVLQNVRVAYFECLRCVALLQVANEALSLSEEHLHQAQSLFKGGMASRGDVLRVKVSVNQSKLDIVTAQSRLDVAVTSLEQAVGVSVDRYKIIKKLPAGTVDSLAPPVYTIPENYVELALAQRAEMHAYGFYRERAKSLVNAAKGQRAPRISLSGRLNSDEDANTLATGEWYVQLDVQWMLFDGGKMAADVNKAKSAEREVIKQIELIASQVTQEAKAAGINLQSAITKRDLAYEQMQTSKEDYRIALRRYDAQIGTNLDVLDARRSLISSRTEYVNAVYDIAKAQSDLIYALGEDDVSVKSYNLNSAD